MRLGRSYHLPLRKIEKVVWSSWASFEGTRGREIWIFDAIFLDGKLYSTSIWSDNFFRNSAYKYVFLRGYFHFLPRFGIYQNQNPTLWIPWDKNKKSELYKLIFLTRGIQWFLFGHFLSFERVLG